MSHMMASREGATVATDGGGAERPPRLATTLYELLAALQDVVGPEEDALIVATVRHLLQSGRLTWLGEARERLCESAWEEAGIVNIGTGSEFCKTILPRAVVGEH